MYQAGDLGWLVICPGTEAKHRQIAKLLKSAACFLIML